MTAGAQPFVLEGVVSAEDGDVVALRELPEQPVVRPHALIVDRDQKDSQRGDDVASPHGTTGPTVDSWPAAVAHASTAAGDCGA